MYLFWARARAENDVVGAARLLRWRASRTSRGAEVAGDAVISLSSASASIRHAPLAPTRPAAKSSVLDRASDRVLVDAETVSRVLHRQVLDVAARPVVRQHLGGSASGRFDKHRQNPTDEAEFVRLEEGGGFVGGQREPGAGRPVMPRSERPWEICRALRLLRGVARVPGCWRGVARRASRWRRPPLGTSARWQLGGSLGVPHVVRIECLAGPGRAHPAAERSRGTLRPRAYYVVRRGDRGSESPPRGTPR